jgi:hypothetical protein
MAPLFSGGLSGPNSMRNHAENATSKVYTLYLGYELTSTTEAFLDIETWRASPIWRWCTIPT